MSIQVAGGIIPEFGLADRLRKARELAELDQSEIARDLGASRATISNAERGTHAARRSLVIAWAMRTGVNLRWLETGEAPSPGGDGASAGYTPWDSNPEPTDYVVPAIALFPGVAA